MHQAQPKEGHKIWLTQEADAKSWSSLKHVQPKEGRKELAPREIKFRYRMSYQRDFAYQKYIGTVFGSTFASEHSVTELFGHLKIRNIRRP